MVSDLSKNQYIISRSILTLLCTYILVAFDLIFFIYHINNTFEI